MILWPPPSAAFVADKCELWVLLKHEICAVNGQIADGMVSSFAAAIKVLSQKLLLLFGGGAIR